MQKMTFYLAIHGLLEISEKQDRKTIMQLVELSAEGIANE